MYLLLLQTSNFSLYPYVCKYAVFPIRHPEILTENFQEIEAGANPYFGIIKSVS